MPLEKNNSFSLQKFDNTQLKLTPIFESNNGAPVDKPPC